jgi:glycosyltransferase involved in cell wall biosynthesis
MNVLYVTLYNAKEMIHWSGAGYFTSKALENQGFKLEYLGNLKVKNFYYQYAKSKIHKYLLKDVYLFSRNLKVIKYFAKQINDKLKRSKIDVIFSPSSIPIALLDTNIPIVFYTDAPFSAMVGFYDRLSNLCKESLRDGHIAEQAALKRANAVCYTSNWAIESALKHYKVLKEKLHLVPFGANVDHEYDIKDIKKIINARSKSVCRLLFIAVDWHRKGGDIVLNVANNIRKRGLDVRLTIIGCGPGDSVKMPSFVTNYRYLNKEIKEEKELFFKLIKESHFLFVPSLAEAFGFVFCDANSFGIPAVSHSIGGIPTVIKNGVNGMTFPIGSSVETFSDYFIEVFTDFDKYRKLALSSFNEYRTRLNWNSIGEQFAEIIKSLL